MFPQKMVESKEWVKRMQLWWGAENRDVRSHITSALQQPQGWLGLWAMKNTVDVQLMLVQEHLIFYQYFTSL